MSASSEPSSSCKRQRWVAAPGNRRVLATPVVAMLLLLAGCNSIQAEPTATTTAVATRIAVTREMIPPSSPTAQPTTEVQAGDHLVVCLAEEPTSLFYPDQGSPAARAVLAGIFEPDIVTLSYEWQAQGLEKVPSINEGDATVRLVAVDEGDLVVDANGDVVALAAGNRVLTADGSVTTFVGTPLQMEQMVVDYVMKQRYWSDGRPVTAADSVFAFELAADPRTGSDTFKTERTARYHATGSLRTRWTGLPGFRDPAFAANFWQPRPWHLWEDIPSAQLARAEASAIKPVGDGPFQVVEWLAGSYIRLEPNPYYYRAADGLPRLDSVTFVFVPDLNERIARLLGGRCHIMSSDGLAPDIVPFFEEARDAALLNLYSRQGAELVELSFGVNSWSEFGDGAGRPDWFEDARVRRAVAMCIDRQAIVDTLLLGQTAVAHSYLPLVHPEYADDVTEWPYDPQAASLLLDETPYTDNDNDGIREDPLTGRAFEVSLLVDTSRHDRTLGQRLAQDLSQCGIGVTVVPMATSERLAQDGTGPIFGRQYDLAIVSSTTGIIPDCERFALWQLTGAPDEINPSNNNPYAGWDGSNHSGWSDRAYDTICSAALGTPAGTPEFTQHHRDAQRLYALNLPAVPIYFNPSFLVARPEVLHIASDPSAETELWNLFQIDLAS